MKIRWKKSNRNIMKNSARICTSKIMSKIACWAITESPVRIHDYLKIGSEECRNIPFSDFPEVINEALHRRISAALRV